MSSAFGVVKFRKELKLDANDRWDEEVKIWSVIEVAT